MKKFVKSIEICPDNIWEVLNCPIVNGTNKVTGFVCEEGRGYPYTALGAFTIDVSGFDLPFKIGCGNVLALDVCGTWYAFTEKEWNKHKDDEI